MRTFGLVLGLLMMRLALPATPIITQSLSPTEVKVGESATLTITASGADASSISEPQVPGLNFNEIGQASRIQSINGVTTSATSMTFEVTAEQPGVYSIPAPAPGAQPVVLTVAPSGSAAGSVAGGAGAATGSATGAGAPPTAGAGAGSQESPTHLSADGAAFVRLRVPKHNIYVGESVPIDVEVGLRDGLVASLNGPPTLNGDAFTLNPLPSRPDSREAIVDGRPFTVLTWHSLLSAVKPGSLSLTVETPLTVRLRTTRSGSGVFGPGFDDPFDDPIFQNFFRGRSFFGTTQKDITISSAPLGFEIAPLPTEGRPASFSGAVGQFTVRSELSDQNAAAGDPLTLRLRITGSGNFDRVSDPMLRDVPGWKTYDPTSQFKPSDEIGFTGEKIFEQPLIATDAGAQTLPPIEFSYFDPTAGRYEVARTTPLGVEITPAPANSSVAQALHPKPPTTSPKASPKPGDGLRPDHVETPGGVSSLMPLYAEPRVLAAAGGLLLAFGLAAAWLHQRPHARARRAERRRRAQSLATAPLLAAMDRARKCNDADAFFAAAQTFMQRVLAVRWKVAPDSVTLEAVDARLGVDSEVARVFRLADEARYAGLDPTGVDLQQWSQVIRRQASARA